MNTKEKTLEIVSGTLLVPKPESGFKINNQREPGIVSIILNVKGKTVRFVDLNKPTDFPLFHSFGFKLRFIDEIFAFCGSPGADFEKLDMQNIFCTYCSLGEYLPFEPKGGGSFSKSLHWMPIGLYELKKFFTAFMEGDLNVPDFKFFYGSRILNLDQMDSFYLIPQDAFTDFKFEKIVLWDEQEETDLHPKLLRRTRPLSLAVCP